MKLTGLAKYAWGVLVYNVFVTLWGAYVRVTGSGAGCGSSWPLCNGEVIPSLTRAETLIGFVHRASSGLALLLIVGLLIWTLRVHPKGRPARLGAGLSMLFIVIEALIGAGLALFRLALSGASTNGVIVIAVLLVNTLLLLAVLAMTAWWASGGESLVLKGHGVGLWLFLIALLSVALVSVLGSVSLFPWHWIIAIVVGLYLLFMCTLIVLFRASHIIQGFSAAVVGFFVLQLIAGGINSWLSSPVWMQVVHFFLTVMVWLMLVLMAGTNFAKSEVCQSVNVSK